jgi:hypothetical protein
MKAIQNPLAMRRIAFAGQLEKLKLLSESRD